METTKKEKRAFNVLFLFFRLSEKCGICYTVSWKLKNKMGESMADENIQAESRRKRVKRLKKVIILLLLISIAIPTVLCVVLAVRTNSLNRSVELLSEQVKQLTLTVAEQQEQLAQLTEELQAVAADELKAEAGSIVSETVKTQASKKEAEILQKEEVKTEQSEAGETNLTEKQQADISAKRKVYLTFDDGPSIYTQDILDILARYEVKATFFVLGKESDADKEAMKRIVEEGHTLGIHSYSHRYSEIYASVENFAADFEKLQNLLYEVTGVRSTVYRFPGGSSNKVSEIPMEEFAEYLAENQVRYYDWNVSSEDGTGTNLPVEQLVQSSTRNLEKYETAIILFHDSADKRTTVEALPIIIENILALEDTVILPITEETEPVQHKKWQTVTSESLTNEGLED